MKQSPKVMLTAISSSKNAHILFFFPREFYLYHLLFSTAYGMTTDGHTTYINGSNCTLRYKPHNAPIVFDFPIPEGHSKDELDQLPVNNLDQH